MIVEEVKINTGEGTRSVKELRAELKGLKDELLNTQKGTEEYAQAMQKAANIQHELKEQMQEINNSAMDFGQKLGNATKVMTGVSGAITAATGALSLFGIENEEAQKKITATMTSLIGITQGLSKIDDGVKAFKRLTIAINASSKSMNGFKVALLASGIGALVVILGSVIAYWDEFTEAIGLSSKQLERLGDIARGVFNVFTSSLKGIAIALGKMIKGDFSGAVKALKDGFSIVKNFNQGVADSQRKREEAMTKKQKEESGKRVKIAEDEAKKLMELEAKLAKYEKDMALAKLRGDDAQKYSQKTREIMERYFERMFSLYDEESEEYKNLILEKEQWLQDWENHFIEESNREQEENRKKEETAKAAALAEKQRQDEERKRQIDTDRGTIEGFFSDDTIAAQQERLDTLYDMAVQAAYRLGIDTNMIEKEFLLKKVQMWMGVYSELAGHIGNIIGSIGDMMEEGSNEQKAMAIAATTIQTLVGIATAISGAFTTKSGPWDIALAAAQATAIAVSGAASIKKIAAVKPSGTSASIDVPNVNVGAVAASTPEFQPTMTGYQTQTAITDQRVYVLEHDITETQQKVQVAESRATY